MPVRQNEIHAIRPAAPDEIVGGLLVLPFSQVLPLSAGDSQEGYGKTGQYVMIASVRGNVSVATHGKYVVLQPGQVLALHEPGAYTVQAVADCLCMEVHMQGELADRLLLDLMEDDSVVFSRSASAVRETVMTLSVLEDEHAPVSGDAASAYAYSLLIKLRDDHLRQQEEEDHLPPLVESAISIIQEEFPFLEGLDELAERLEVSKAHLIRTFTKKTGISPGKYITRVRIEYAKLLLQDEDASISYVAESSGFANANYFAKVFRRETGMSPTEYLETVPNRREHRSSRRLSQAIW
jgi:AraC-like DNA-binding protein